MQIYETFWITFFLGRISLKCKSVWTERLNLFDVRVREPRTHWSVFLTHPGKSHTYLRICRTRDHFRSFVDSTQNDSFWASNFEDKNESSYNLHSWRKRPLLTSAFFSRKFAVVAGLKQEIEVNSGKFRKICQVRSSRLENYNFPYLNWIITKLRCVNLGPVVHL